MANRFGADNIDDFIASEMNNIDGAAESTGTKPTMRPSGPGGGTGNKSVASKPNFGFSMSSKKSGGAFAKPSFAKMGGSKNTGATAGVSSGPPVISKSNFSSVTSGPQKITLKKR